MADRALVEALDRLPQTTHDGFTFRHVAFGYAALSGEGARIQGGRWNPPESFPVLYTALNVETVSAELVRTATRSNVRPEDLLPRRLLTYNVRLNRVLDLTQGDNLAALNLTTSLVTSDNLVVTQAVGEAAHYVGYEGVLAPSAAHPAGTALAIFTTRLLPISSVTVANDAEIKSLDDLVGRILGKKTT